MINDAAVVASNSFLCGFLRQGTAEEFVAGWYTSLTRLFVELEVHSLGGGVLILVPGEIGKVRLPLIQAGSASMEMIDERLRSGDIAGAYEAGDSLLYDSPIDLSAGDVNMIREGIETLRRWRTRDQGRAAVWQTKGRWIVEPT